MAIPGAMTFFRAAVARGDVVWTAVAFVAGLTCVAIAQGAAFMTMARRAEAHVHYAWAQFHRVAALQYQHGTPDNVQRLASSSADETTGNTKLRRSNIWRRVGLSFFFLSLVAFITGCWWGANAVLTANDKTVLIAEKIKPV